MIVDQHIIHRQVLELTLPEQEGAYALQKRIGGLFKEKAAPLLEQSFDRFGVGSDTYRIQRLEIDLGEISMETLETTFVDLLKRKVDAALEKLSNRESVVAYTTKIKNEKRAWDIFHYFLKTGRLPWYATPEEFTELVTSISAELDTISMAELETLKRAFKTDSIILKRFIRQFEKGFVNDFLETVFSVSHEYSVSIETQYQSRTGQKIRWKDREKLWELIQEQGTELPSEEVVEKLIEAGRTDIEIDDKGRLPNDLVSNENGDKNQTDYPLKTPENGHAVLEQEDKKPYPESKERLHDELLAGGSASENQGNTALNTLETDNPEIEEMSAWHSMHAGSVLLAPFLPDFFKRLGLLENGQFKTENTRERALHLLQYLVSGEIDGMEYQQLIFKVLCGIPINRPILKEFEILKTEIDEAEQLLKAVIGHWSALKNTSPEGLREGFLQRRGKLNHHEEKWHLQVEQKPHDILLDKLPWTVSIVQLPWMEKRMEVDWVT